MAVKLLAAARQPGAGSWRNFRSPAFFPPAAPVPNPFPSIEADVLEVGGAAVDALGRGGDPVGETARFGDRVHQRLMGCALQPTPRSAKPRACFNRIGTCPRLRRLVTR